MSLRQQLIKINNKSSFADFFSIYHINLRSSKKRMGHFIKCLLLYVIWNFKLAWSKVKIRINSVLKKITI